MVQQRPQPRLFLALCMLTTSLILLLYGILVLYPSYASGIYLSPDPSLGSFTVPIYDHLNNTIWDANNQWLLHLLYIILTAAFTVAPLLTIAMLAVIGWRWWVIPSREGRFWLAFIGISWGIILLTAQVGLKFAAWLVD